ncbi:ADP-ribosylation factor family [Brugia malayi]|uniref:ADP-ribosylation factor family n=2 Tax=Brugia TaxID=6278 RepID=A0A0K0JWN1_BRUMA|nr:ADP-ribosylation factor family [Brugia malayi]CDQ06103.1 BMA-ARL-13 [Brugia malayi]VIO97160.1 ADP-ribosylation factor family [Brugia malayi]
MGNCVGGFKQNKRKLHHKKVRKIRICILGIDGAGKSTAICSLASGEINNVLPTNGFTLHEFRYRKAEIIAYDLGGGERIRSIWKNYYPEVFGVIYIIDGSDEDRIEESGQLLKDVISDKDLMNKPFLIILNKKDRGRCIDEIQFTDRFNLHNLANRYQTQIRVEICQSNAGSGRMIDVTLKDGFEWLLEQIYYNYDALEKRVNEALEKLKRRQNEERIRRQHHLAATISSSTISEDEKISDADVIEVVAQNDKQQNDQMIISSQKATINQINNSENGNEESKRKRCLRNMISPMDSLSHTSNDLVKMKYPQIFEVSSSEVSKKTASVQTVEMFDMNGDIQSTSKPIRITQLVPMSVIRKERPKHSARLIRRRTDSV